MSHYKPYPAYKDSGVKWLGDVPVNWEIKKLFHLGVDIKTGKVDVNIQSPEGKYPFFTCGREPRFADQYSFDCEALLIAGNGEVGHTNYFNGKFEAYQRTYVVSGFKRIHPKYLEYYVKEFLSKAVSDSVVGSVIQFITLGDLRGFCVAFPLEEEQVNICRFLDSETTRIDALIGKKTRFIELLREKRQALITHAVTKGLDPNVRMKDSGVEWLGDVPEHWEVKPIKWLSPVQRGASPRPIDDPKYFDDDGKHGWVRIEDVTSSGGYLKETKQKLSELGSSLSVKLPIGSLFLSIAGTVGKPCISLVDACIHDGFVYFPLLKINPEWLFRVFECKTPFVGLGKMGTQLNLNTETVGGIFVGLPPAEEIQNILEVMREQLTRIDTIIGRSERSIELLKERRSALITAAVTGQIDLREAA